MGEALNRNFQLTLEQFHTFRGVELEDGQIYE